MARQERQTIRHMGALLRAAIAIGIAMAFSSARATELTCEPSHLPVPSAQNLEQNASNLAKFRLQIYQMTNDSGEKSRADQEFKSKYNEFESLIGNKDKAKEIFQAQMKLSKKSGSIDEAKESERKNQKERELDFLDPVKSARKMAFNEIRPGAFKMGHSNHIYVEITKPFAMMATLVTQMMWSRIKVASGEKDPTNLNPSYYKNGEESSFIKLAGIEVPMKPDHPVEMVNFAQIKTWIADLNRISVSEDPADQALLKELIPDHQKGDLYDLPTEAQWEFVMRNRGQSNQQYFDHDNELLTGEYAWVNENSGESTHAVATRKPRLIDGMPFYDLEGNLWEWTRDGFQNKLTGGVDPEIPIDDVNPFIVTRGGDWTSSAKRITTSVRSATHAGAKNYTLGFRLVRTRP